VPKGQETPILIQNYVFVPERNQWPKTE